MNPETDDPIDETEVKEACSQTKKGGYDFSINCLLLLLSIIGGVLLLLMNKILFGSFPLRLCTSILTVIPKLGNLRLSDNYRRIQMLPLLANVFDRTLCIRLIRWAKINFEQTAFQKGKSGIDQIFILRVIVSLMKASGKCTTDHISPAGKWLQFRGHLENISQNLFIGVNNAFTEKAGEGINQLDNSTMSLPDIAKSYHEEGINWIAVGDENYGEGSSREHAAMEPRFRGCKVVLVKSFARIHEANLKKQGILDLTFNTKTDYEKIFENYEKEVENHNNFSYEQVDVCLPDVCVPEKCAEGECSTRKVKEL